VSDWKKIFEEKVSRDHRSRVLNEANSLLKENPRRNWLRSALVIGLGSAAAVILTLRSRNPSEEIIAERPEEREQLTAALTDSEMLDEAELLQDLDLLESLEDLEEWEES
jgi:hypothetical protein